MRWMLNAVQLGFVVCSYECTATSIIGLKPSAIRYFHALARFYLSEIAMGLCDLHQLGFVHRDMKPENVLITRSGHIKLVDFGSAGRLDSQGQVVSRKMALLVWYIL